MSNRPSLFKMVKGETTEEAEEKVNLALAEGFDLHGTAFPVVTATHENGINVYFVQPMVKREAKKYPLKVASAHTVPPRDEPVKPDTVGIEDTITFGKYQYKKVEWVLENDP